jgi:hypothetical protein
VDAENGLKEQAMNHAAKTIVSVFGIILGISGMNHGFFEALQGNTPTPGLIVQAIGPANRFWVYGTEEAFTIVPNFLITGILAMAVALAIMIWSARFIQTKHGSTVFILLFVLLFLVGGGIGQIVFFLPIWAFSTQINKPLTGWQKMLPVTLRGFLAMLWPYTLAIACGLFLFALEIAIFGFVPGENTADQKLFLCWSCLGIGWVILLLTFAAGFAADITKRVGSATGFRPG